MRFMVSEFKFLVPLLYPLVSFGGMLQVYGFWAISRAFSTAIPEPSMIQLFFISLIYPAFLTAFFRVNASKLTFQFSTVMFLSAIFGLLVFPMLNVLFALVVPGIGGSNVWLNVVALLFDVALAFAFLFALSETDFHKLSNNLIVGSLVCFEITSLGILFYATGAFLKIYTVVTQQVATLFS